MTTKRSLPFLLLFAGALVLLGVVGRPTPQADVSDAQPIAIPLPLPIYEIEGSYNGLPLRLLNLPLAPLGVVPVPIPVDLNRDLIPDVTVAVNLVNVAGLFENPTDVGNILAPNLEVNRLLPGLPLTALESSLRINAKLTILDLGSSEPPTFLRLGYETGQGGSIPSKFKVTADGLAGFFDPVTAAVETPGYQGPLSLVAGFEQGSSRADAALRFAPLPYALQFTYGSVGDAQRVSASHGGAMGGTMPADLEVDLDADIKLVDGADVATVKARVDRLPYGLDVLIKPGADGSGGFEYQASTAGRLPDVRVDATTTSPGSEPLVARLDLEGLPPELEAEWALPEDGNAAVRLSAAERPIGAVEARVANFLGSEADAGLPGYVPAAQQYVDLRQTGEDRLITARVEGVSLVDFQETDRGIDGQFASSGGGRPLELHTSMDAVGEAARRLVATSTVSPLPAELRATVNDAGETDEPLTVRYEASDSVDVDGHLEVRDADVAAAAPCGDAGTICADLNVRDIPTSIETRIEQLTRGDDPDEVRVAVDAEPRAEASPPDVFADVIFGQDDGVPFVAHAEALAIPAHLRVRAVDGADQTTARAEFHACDRRYAADGVVDEDECVGAEGQVGALAFSLRNFLGDRPAGLPILVADEPNRATVAARGRAGDPDVVDFEAAGRVAAVRELRYVDDGVFGLRARVGGGGDLKAVVDLAGIDLGGEGLSDLRAEARVPDVPDRIDVCFRGAGVPIADEPIDEVTEPCEDADPFTVAADEETPLTVAYRSSDTIDATTALHLIDHGATGDTADDLVVDAALDIENLPAEATAHVLAPEDGAVRAVYDTGAVDPTATDPTRLHFEGRIADGGLACQDPREVAEGDKVFCIEGTIVGLPSRATFVYDDELPADNLKVTTTGTIDIEDFGLSVIEGEDDGPSVLVVDGAIDDIPASLTATLQTEEDGPTAVRLAASPPIGGVEATVQNFVGADPLPAGPPAQRTGLPPVDPATYDTVTLLQRGDEFRAIVDITQLERAGYASYASGKDEDDEEVSTHAVDLGFGDDRNVRAYVDVDDGTTQAIADVTLEDRPAGMGMCFRGARTTVVAPPTGVTPSFCDTSTSADGAVELRAEPHAAGEQLDVAAFFRVADEVGETISGYVDVDDLPPVLRTELATPEADALVEALDAAGQPASIGRMAFHVASFDIADHGYAFPPFALQPKGAPFPAPAAAGQHLGAVVTDNDFDVRGLIGSPAPGQPGSRLERLRLAADACPAPTGVAADTYPNYPAIAAGTESPYTCAQIDFEPVGGADPLAIGLTIAKASRRVVVRDASLSDVPGALALTLADLPATAGDDPSTPQDESTFLPRCATAGDTRPGAGTCAPPMLRVDTGGTAGQPTLAAIVEVGDQPAIDALGAIVTPADDLPDLGASPTVAGWSDWGADPRGIRLALAQEPGIDGELALRAGIRIPLPQALSVHPFQSWDDERTSDTAGDQQKWSAKDVGFGYEATFADPSIQSLGRIAALIRMDDGAQIVATDGTEDPTYVTNGPSTPPSIRTPLGIPKELDVQFYRRDNLLAGRELIQVDGRVNAPMDLRVRMFPAPPTEPDEDPGAVIDAHLTNLPAETAADQTDPSFRIRAELVKPKEPLGGTPPSNDDGECDGFLFGTETCDAKIVVTTISAAFDFQPVPTQAPARLLNAVARFDDSTGFQVQAFDAIDGDEVDGDGNFHPSAIVSGELGIELNPMNLNFQAGLFLLGADVEIESILEAYVHLDRVSDFAMRQNAARITGTNKSHGLGEGGAYIDPIMRLEDFDASLYLDLYFFDVDLIGVNYIDFSDIEDAEPISIEFDECGIGGQIVDSLIIDPLKSVGLTLAKSAEALVTGDFEYYIPRALTIPPTGETTDVIAVPDGGDPRMVLEVLEIPLLPFGGGVIASILDGFACVTGPAEMTLIDGDEGFPGDTLLEYTNHPVPDAIASEAEPSVPDNGDPNTDRTIDGFAALCGRHRYRNLTITGNMVVGFTPGPDCPAGSEGYLELVAESITIQDGAVVAVPPNAPGGLFLTADHITVGSLVTSASGPITMDAEESLTVPTTGAIRADESSESIPLGPDGQPLASAPTGNGGAGHGGQGGNGGAGGPFNGGAAYGNEDPRVLRTEAGSPGAGNDPGLGGGVISLQADTLIIAGPISANGGVGFGPGCTSSAPASGGGSGGGIVLAASSLFLAPDVVTANGGDGGPSLSGSGGGGGAGVIKVAAPRTNGSPLPTAPAGGIGGGVCAGGGVLFPDGGGQPLITDLNPQSTFVPEAFWRTEDTDPGTPDQELVTGFDATNVDTANRDFTVVTCGTRLAPAIINQDSDGDGHPDGPPSASKFVMPDATTIDGANPCGQTAFLPLGCSPAGSSNPCTGFSNGGVELGHAYQEDTDQVRFDPNDPDGPGRMVLDGFDDDIENVEGYWGVWTVVLNSTNDDHDCIADGSGGCFVSELKSPVVDAVFGLDDTDPRIVAVAVEDGEGVVRPDPGFNTWYTKNEAVAFTIEATDLPEEAGSIPLSGLGDVECVEIDGSGTRAPFDCSVGRNVHRFLLPGDGSRRIEITAVDSAGNRHREAGSTNFPDDDLQIFIDRTAPTGSPGLFGPHADLSPATPDGDNGWYRTAPTIRLLTPLDTKNSDGSAGVGVPANTPAAGPDGAAWRYRFDDGEEQACVDEPEEVTSPPDACRIADTLPSGTHVVHFTAVDQLGNRLEVDEMFATDEIKIDGTAPASAAQFVPLTPDGAGGWYRTAPVVVLSAIDEPGGSGVAGRFYRLDGGPEQPFTEPIPVGAGTHQVCWRATDVAGNADVGVAGVVPTIAQFEAAGHCVSAQVDLADPVSALTVSPAAPTGGAGWYTAPPTVALSVTDAAPGSGVAAANRFVSVDGAPFAAYAGPVTVPEGVHNVRAYAVDGAGRRSAVVEQVVRVDQSAPVASARLVPPSPARANWYRRLPTLVLRATDGSANSGVTRLEYRIDGGAFTPYTGPVVMAAGQHVVGYRAVDAAGRTSPVTNLPVDVDNGAPTVQALAPSPGIWSRLLGPPTAQLAWTVSDDRAGTLRLWVLVYDLGGNLIRRLDAGTRTVTAGGTVSGTTAWDGRNSAGSNLTIGVYHYRVVATDAAGNRSMSNTSRPLQLKLL